MARRESGSLYAGEGKERKRIYWRIMLGRHRRRDSLSSLPIFPQPPTSRHQVPIARAREGRSGVHLMLDTEPDLKTDENKAGGPPRFLLVADERPALVGPDGHTYMRVS